MPGAPCGKKNTTLQYLMGQQVCTNRLSSSGGVKTCGWAATDALFLPCLSWCSPAHGRNGGTFPVVRRYVPCPQLGRISQEPLPLLHNDLSSFWPKVRSCTAGPWTPAACLLTVFSVIVVMLPGPAGGLVQALGTAAAATVPSQPLPVWALLHQIWASLSPTCQTERASSEP